MPEVFVSLLAATIAALAGAVIPGLRSLIELLVDKAGPESFFLKDPLGKAIAKAFGAAKERSDPDSFFKDLTEASQNMDAAVKRIQDYTLAREQAVKKLEAEVGLLNQQEKEMQARIAGLQNVPLPAADYFAQIIEKREKKSAYRDYALFLLGVIVSAGVAILLKKLGWG